MTPYGGLHASGGQLGLTALLIVMEPFVPFTQCNAGLPFWDGVGLFQAELFISLGGGSSFFFEFFFQLSQFIFILSFPKKRTKIAFWIGFSGKISGPTEAVRFGHALFRWEGGS